MMETLCPRCGGELPAPEGDGGEKVRVVCQTCGAQLQVFISTDIGVETLFQPHLLSEESADEKETEEVDEGAGTRPVAGGSGTALLDSKKRSPETLHLETTVRGFLILAGALPGEERLPLVGAKTVVGREEADIVIDDPALSGSHFEVEARGDEFFIRDLDSSNGTLVNGHKVRTRQLRSGDKVEAGETTFTFSTLEVVPWDRPE